MSFSRVRLDHRGVGEVMRSGPVRAVVSSVSEEVGAGLRVSGRPVEVLIEPAVSSGGIRDARPVGRVTVLSADAMGQEVKHGLLTGAARSAGLEVGG